MKSKAKIIVILLIIIGVLTAIACLAKYVIFKDYFTALEAKPSITLKGDNPLEMQAGKEYEEPGYSAEVLGKDFTKNVKVDSSAVNIKELGTYTVSYSVSNEKGMNTITETRVVKVIDTTAPVIKLTDVAEMKKFVGDPYKEPGAKATDNLDGDLTKQIKISGSKVDTSKAGTYEVKYTVTDSNGNKAEAVRKIIVTDVVTNPVYLTFDDGPSRNNTPVILDALKKYNAHATFFLIGQNIPGNEDLVKRIVDEGHTVAVHTDTHDYAAIYKSAEAFWADNEKCRARIKKVTGKEVDLMRFPGGASNTISANYCKGIMSTLVSQTKAHKYEYFDYRRNFRVR